MEYIVIVSMLKNGHYLAICETGTKWKERDKKKKLIAQLIIAN